jgi:Flp pilus assembly protein TadG
MARSRPLLLRLRLPQPISRFRSNENGATAVEFALVALPFFSIIFAIFQTAIIMFANQALQTTASDVSRQIMTGEIKAADGLGAFKTKLCANIDGMFDCDKVMVQVKSFTNFSSANPSDFYDAGCFTPESEDDPGTGCWAPGGPRSVVLVRVAYEWPFGINFEDLNNKTLLVAISAFRNEPF